MKPQPAEDAVAAKEITRQASARVLGNRPRLRLLIASVWSGFLGGAVLLFAWLVLTPETMLGPRTLGQLSFVFFAGWALSLVPAFSAALLVAPMPGPAHPNEPDDGI